MGSFAVLNFERGCLRIRRAGDRSRARSKPDRQQGSAAALINSGESWNPSMPVLPDSPGWIKGSAPHPLTPKGLAGFCSSLPLNFTLTQITAWGVWWWSIVLTGFWLSGCSLFFSPAKAAHSLGVWRVGVETQWKRSWKSNRVCV